MTLDEPAAGATVEVAEGAGYDLAGNPSMAAVKYVDVAAKSGASAYSESFLVLILSVLVFLS